MRKFTCFLFTLLLLSCETNNNFSKRDLRSFLAPIIFSDTISIKEPVVVLYDTVFYITSKEILHEVEKTSLNKRSDILPYLIHTGSRVSSFVSDRNIKDYTNSFIYEEESDVLFGINYYVFSNLEYIDSIGNMAILNFKIKPDYYQLCLISDNLTVFFLKNFDGCQFGGADIEYSMNYKPMLLPVYNSKKEKVLREIYIENKIKELEYLENNGCFDSTLTIKNSNIKIMPIFDKIYRTYSSEDSIVAPK